MKAHLALIAAVVTVAAASGCAPGAASEGDRQAKSAQPPSDRSQSLRHNGPIKTFEFLGCSGDWADEGNTPDVWRTGSERGTYFLVRHADTCGYTIGSKPAAKIDGNSLELTYELSSPDGAVAACPCEYWAKFELIGAPAKLEKISVNGVEARLKGGLAER
jgi:hypothetical protein